MKELTKIAVLIMLILLGYPSYAQERGIVVVPIKNHSGKEIFLYEESHALVVGMSNYREGWQTLPGVLKDVEKVRHALEQKGFHVITVKNLSRDELRAAMEDFINRYGHETDNRLIFYFAGHGHTLKLSYGEEMGYFVPVDAPNPNRNEAGFMAKSFNMELIEVFAKQIQAKHALFLFDSCFSGSIFALSRAVPENISYKTSEPVRQFITSGSAGETVSDESIFRDQFIRALNGEGDLDSDGYVTGVELGEFLQQTVINYSKGSQHPQYGKIRNPNLDKGDFVFSLLDRRRVEESVNPIIQERKKLEQDLLRLEDRKKRVVALQRLQEEKRKLEEAKKRLEEEQKKSTNLKNEAFQSKPEKRKTKVWVDDFADEKLASISPQIMPKSKFSDQCPDNMAFIPAGVFMAGEVKDLSEMSIDAFCIDKYEVTQAEYKRVMGDNPSYYKEPLRCHTKCGDLPVERVTWFQAKQYCENANKRLPTDWEWEKAAKAGTTTKYYWGNEIDDSYLWHYDNSRSVTHPVGQKKPNRYGLYDMFGNVWEWTSSDYDGSGNKVLRGGAFSFFPFLPNDLEYGRQGYYPTFRTSNFGFRCVQ